MNDFLGKMGDFFKNIGIPLITVISGLLIAWLNYSVSTLDRRAGKLNKQLKQQQSSLEKLATERNPKKFEEDLAFRIYEAAIESLQEEDARQQQAALAQVIVMSEEPLRTGLLQTFEKTQTTAPQVRQQVAEILATEQRFRLEEDAAKFAAVTMTAPASDDTGWGDWAFDVLWCQKSDESARGKADAIVKALKNAGAEGRLRVRFLPESINAQRGYRISGYVIRSDVGEEKRAAELKKVGESVLQGAKFEILQSNSGTPKYLSAFICP